MNDVLDGLNDADTKEGHRQGRGSLPPGFVYIVGARRLLQVVVDLIERAWSEGDLR